MNDTRNLRYDLVNGEMVTKPEGEFVMFGDYLEERQNLTHSRNYLLGIVKAASKAAQKSADETLPQAVERLTTQLEQATAELMEAKADPKLWKLIHEWENVAKVKRDEAAAMKYFKGIGLSREVMAETMTHCANELRAATSPAAAQEGKA